jgi:hypothetical protein
MINPLAFIPKNINLKPIIAPQTEQKIEIDEVAVVGHSLIKAVESGTDLDNKVGYFHGKPSASYNRQGVLIPPLKPIIEAQLRDPKIKAVAIMAFANQVDMPPEKFQDEIKDLTNLAKSNGKKLILITEPTKSDPHKTGHGKPLGNMAKMNDIMRDFARDNPDNIALIDIHKFPESIYKRNYLHQYPPFYKMLRTKIEAVATGSSTANLSDTAQPVSRESSSGTAKNELKVFLPNFTVAKVGVDHLPSEYKQITRNDGSVLVRGPRADLLFHQGLKEFNMLMPKIIRIAEII